MSRIIQSCDRSVLPGGRRVAAAINHIFWRFDLDSGGSLIFESQPSHGVELVPYEHLSLAMATGKVVREREFVLNLNRERREGLWDSCVRLRGHGYDKRLIALYYLQMRVLPAGYDWVLWFQARDHYTCNELVIDTGALWVPELRTVDRKSTPEQLFRLFHKESSAEFFGLEVTHG